MPARIPALVDRISQVSPPNLASSSLTCTYRGELDSLYGDLQQGIFALCIMVQRLLVHTYPASKHSARVYLICNPQPVVATDGVVCNALQKLGVGLTPIPLGYDMARLVLISPRYCIGPLLIQNKACAVGMRHHTHLSRGWDLLRRPPV